MDRLAGGPGLRRGRRSSHTINYGEALDFWRVTGIEPDRSLELRAEMKLPGEAELSFMIESCRGDEPHCRLIQTARFKPRGLPGLAYWYAVLPFHRIVFSGMIQGIRRTALKIQAKDQGPQYRPHSAEAIESSPTGQTVRPPTC